MFSSDYAHDIGLLALELACYGIQVILHLDPGAEITSSLCMLPQGLRMCMQSAGCV